MTKQSLGMVSLSPSRLSPGRFLRAVFRWHVRVARLRPCGSGARMCRAFTFIPFPSYEDKGSRVRPQRSTPSEASRQGRVDGEDERIS